MLNWCEVIAGKMGAVGGIRGLGIVVARSIRINRVRELLVDNWHLYTAHEAEILNFKG